MGVGEKDLMNLNIQIEKNTDLANVMNESSPKVSPTDAKSSTSRRQITVLKHSNLTPGGSYEIKEQEKT